MLAPSSTFWRRLTSAARSRMSDVRYRVSSRSSRRARSGTALPRSRPCRRRSAIHSQSRTSVFRPGTALMCWALTRSSSKRPSNRFQIGCQYTPVLSIATWVQPAAASQSAKASRSSVIVPKVRTAWRGRRPGRGVTRQATTVFLCTSSPQHRSYSASMAPPSEWQPDGAPTMYRFCCACFPAGSHRRWCRATPRSNWSAGS